MLYHYVAADKNGKVIEADFEADDLRQVLQHIATSELRPLSVNPVKEKRSFRLLFGNITTQDKLFLTKYLSLLLKVGTDLLSAIDILVADFDKPAMKNFLLEIRDNLSKGRHFYEAFANYPQVFSLAFVNLIKAAEESGNLQDTFDQLAVSLQKEAELRGKVRSAIIYPIILIAMSVSIVIFLATFALPKISKVFEESGIQPPIFTKIVFAVSGFINSNLTFLVVLMIAFLVGGTIFFVKTLVGRKIADRALGKVPLIRNIYRELAIQRFAANFSSLMKAGMPIIDSVKITALVVGSEEFRVSLNRIADEGLARGITIGDSFKREAVFPRVVTNLIAVSERGGHLEEVLETVAEFYAANIESNIKALVSVLEPLMLLVLGFMVAAIALSIIIPIYQLTTNF